MDSILFVGSVIIFEVAEAILKTLKSTEKKENNGRIITMINTSNTLPITEQEKKHRNKLPRLKQRVAAIIQARMNSSRLPGKVLLPIGNKSALQHIIDRLQQSKSITDIIVATTVSDEDRKIVNHIKEHYKHGVTIYRGSEEDVLYRVVKAANLVELPNTIIVDITGDCPLVDPIIIDVMVHKLLYYKLDYVSNTITRSWPDGFDVQVYTKEILNKIEQVVINSQHRHHTGWNIVHYSNAFKRPLKMMNIPAPDDCYYPQWGLTLDTAADKELLSTIVSQYPDSHFTAREVIELVKKNLHWLEINNSIKRNIPGMG